MSGSSRYIFPVGGQYQLLSLLTSSLIVSELNERVNELRGKARAARDKNNEEYGKDYDEVRELTVIGFGGTKPQNISVLNSRNRGKAYLLDSCPPSVPKRKVSKPWKDFFANLLWSVKFTEDFHRLHSLFECYRNNRSVRDKINQIVKAIADHVMVSVRNLRAEGPGWSTEERYMQLPLAQKIWLDDIHVEARKENGDWQDEISLSFARWIMHTYEKNAEG